MIRLLPSLASIYSDGRNQLHFHAQEIFMLLNIQIFSNRTWPSSTSIILYVIIL